MIVSRQRALFTAACAAVWLSPAAALACPYCAGNGKSGIATGVILASFIFLPFAIVYAIYRFIRTAPIVAAPTVGVASGHSLKGRPAFSAAVRAHYHASGREAE